MNPEDYVSYPIALALKKHGFDWECDHYWYKVYANSDEMSMRQASADDFNNDDWDVPHCSAPLLWQAQKWLREVKRIEVNASWESIKRYWFFYTNFMDVPDIVNLEEISDSVYSTYEQALSAGIAAALELIENNKNN